MASITATDDPDQTFTIIYPVENDQSRLRFSWVISDELWSNWLDKHSPGTTVESEPFAFTWKGLYLPFHLTLYPRGKDDTSAGAGLYSVFLYLDKMPKPATAVVIETTLTLSPCGHKHSTTFTFETTNGWGKAGGLGPVSDIEEYLGSGESFVLTGDLVISAIHRVSDKTLLGQMPLFLKRECEERLIDKDVEIDVLQTSIRELEKKIKKMDGNHRRTRTRLSKIQEKSAEYREQIVELGGQVEDGGDSPASTSNTRDIRSQNEKLTAEIERLKAENTSLLQRASHADSTQSKLDSLQIKFEKHRVKLQKQTDNLRRDLTRTEEKLAESRDQFRLLEDAASTAQNRTISLEKALNTMKQKKNEAAKRFKIELTNTTSDLTDSLRARTQRNIALEEQLEEFRAETAKNRDLVSEQSYRDLARRFDEKDEELEELKREFDNEMFRRRLSPDVLQSEVIDCVDIERLDEIMDIIHDYEILGVTVTTKIRRVLRDNTSCIVCFGDDRTHATIPCGHRVLCGCCAAETTKDGVSGALGKCLVCRENIEAFLKIYDS